MKKFLIYVMFLKTLSIYMEKVEMLLVVLLTCRGTRGDLLRTFNFVMFTWKFCLFRDSEWKRKEDVEMGGRSMRRKQKRKEMKK